VFDHADEALEQIIALAERYDYESVEPSGGFWRGSNRLTA
jgi:hypothetical protein